LYLQLKIFNVNVNVYVCSVYMNIQYASVTISRC